MQRGNMNGEKEITESKISEMLSNLKTTEENERGKGDMNEEKEITESKISEMLLNLKTMEENERGKGNMNQEKEITESEINEMKRNQRFFEDCAKIGLAQYNAQNGTNFELDKISSENHRLYPGVVYFHLNFIAESSDGSNDEKKRCMFFAEVAGFEERVVNVCCILDPAAGMDSGCRFCSHKVYHPRGYSYRGSLPT